MHLQGFEPGTHWLRVSCSTNWAKGAYDLNGFMAPPTGLEPVTHWLTVRCSTDWAKEECLKILNSEFVLLREITKICGVLNKQSRRFRLTSYRLLHVCRLWAIVPARLQASIVATAKLNFCVRNGNRWTLCVWITDCVSAMSYRPGSSPSKYCCHCKA